MGKQISILTILIIACLLITSSSSAQNNREVINPHYPTYSFQVEAGVSNKADAARLDSALLQLVDMVMSSKTNPETREINVSVLDLRITFESIQDYMKMNGYKASEKYKLVEGD